MRITMALLLMAITCAACGSGGGQTVGGLSAEEAAQLNNAAEMLDARDAPLENAAD